MPLESRFQADFINQLHASFIGCEVLKNDSALRQGIPDLLLLWERHWAMFEVKASANEPFQPNQEFYINKLNKMSVALVVYPENMWEVIRAVQSAFGIGR